MKTQNSTIPTALAIIAPTASGKTALALAIAQAVPCEIISLDSALVYRDMDIGTAKPTAQELASVPHHLINIISPLETYSAADFVHDCLRLVDEIRAKGKLPLIVGGTMMYYHALTQGLNALPEADAATRERLQQV
ncbi:tRNA (adenosine(37)-N6)-dimethylallyltransferase, partial [Kingella kingae]